MKPRVLVVDEEPRVLDGLRRALFVLGSPWLLECVTRADAALALLEQQPFDAIVTEITLAPIDGAELLRQVRDRRPAMLRFVLSGHVDNDTAVRALQVAQQMLAKPCDARALVEAVDSAMAVQRRLADPLVRTIVGRSNRLPSAPRVHFQVTSALLDPQCDAQRVASIIARDPALAANVLHLANSAFFGNGRRAADLQQAVTRLGLATLANLVLATEVFDARRFGGGAERLRSRALQASRVAAHVAHGRSDAQTATTAALLADIGYLVPGIESLPPGAAALSQHAHAEIGAALLALWGLPLPIVEAVAYHHAPAALPRIEFGLAGVVHVALALSEGRDPDDDYLVATQMQARLPDWRRQAREASVGGHA